MCGVGNTTRLFNEKQWNLFHSWFHIIWKRFQETFLHFQGLSNYESDHILYSLYAPFALVQAVTQQPMRHSVQTIVDQAQITFQYFHQGRIFSLWTNIKERSTLKQSSKKISNFKNKLLPDWERDIKTRLNWQNETPLNCFHYI